MIKKVLLFAFLISTLNIAAQKAQRIGYIDMEYILENIPEYNEAQAKINAKAATWQSTIEKQQKEIDDLKAELINEKALLTKELIADKEEDIDIKEIELKKLQVAYFGTNGDLFFLRKQLVQPIQDLVYNSIQDIATKRKYDLVFDKSSDLIMLYTNPQFDISDLVISSITRTKKIEEGKQRKQQNSKGENIVSENDSINNQAKEEKIDERAAKQAALKQKIEEKKAAQLKKREELKKAIEEKRQKRIQEIEAAKKAKEEKNKNN
jgi:Skp family chaperone for outer membrane proteins